MDIQDEIADIETKIQVALVILVKVDDALQKAQQDIGRLNNIVHNTIVDLRTVQDEQAKMRGLPLERDAVLPVDIEDEPKDLLELQEKGFT